MTAKFFWYTLLLLPAITGHAQTNTQTDTQTIKTTGPPDITQTKLHSPVSLRSKATRPNSFYISALGPGTAGSLNYELRFQSEDHLGWGIRVGFGYAIPYRETVERRDTGGNYKSTTSRWPGKITVPFGFNCLIGKRGTSHRFEMGFGVTYVNGDAVLFDNVTTTHTWLLFATLYYLPQRVFQPGPVVVEGRCCASTLFVRYRPNAGPLAGSRHRIYVLAVQFQVNIFPVISHAQDTLFSLVYHRFPPA